MIEEYEYAVNVGNAKSFIAHLRDYALLVLTFPFLLVGFVAGCVCHFVKLCAGALVTGWKRGWNGLIGG